VSHGVARRVIPTLLLLAGGIAVASVVRASSTTPSFSWQSLAAFTAAFFVALLLAVRLPKGNEAHVTLMVSLTAVIVLDVFSAMFASVLAGCLHVFGKRAHADTALLPEVLEMGRSVAAIGIMAAWQPPLLPMLTETAETGQTVWWILLAGVTYAALDLMTLAIVQPSPRSTVGRIQELWHPLGMVYLVHIAMATVVVRLYYAPGAWVFPIGLLLTLILQNSFNQYLRIRRAYGETIDALAHAAELDRPGDSGHSRRVSDLSVAVGRTLRLANRDLEQLGLAGLLHDIGRIGDRSEEGTDEYDRRGAEIAASVPLLESVAHFVYWEGGASTEPIGRTIVRLVSRYDRMNVRLDAPDAIRAVRESTDGLTGQEERVIDALEDVVVARGTSSGPGVAGC